MIDKNGKMIGITSVKITSAEGIGFAIPINLVKPIIERFMQEGKFEEPYIGIYGYDENVIPYLDSKITFSGRNIYSKYRLKWSS